MWVASTLVTSIFTDPVSTQLILSNPISLSLLPVVALSSYSLWKESCWSRVATGLRGRERLGEVVTRNHVQYQGREPY